MENPKESRYVKRTQKDYTMSFKLQRLCLIRYIPYNFLHSHYGYINIRIENKSFAIR